MQKLTVFLTVTVALVTSGCASPPRDKSSPAPSKVSKKKSDENQGNLSANMRTDCKATREYITTYRYLEKRKKELGLSEDQIRKNSGKVSKGCTGAASRFIEAVEVLSRVKLATADAIKTATELAQRDKKVTQTFIGVFKKAYLRENLDLSLNASMKIARRLSLNYQGASGKALNDFSRITRFCIENQGLNLPLPFCANMAKKIAVKGEYFKQQLAPPFMESYKFLRENKALNLSIKNALTIAKKIVTISPVAHENFKKAFEFGLSQKGLNLNARKALDFAQSLTRRTRQVPLTPFFEKTNVRQPANKQDK